MFRMRNEAGLIKYGFNFYHFSDKINRGFILKYWHNKSLWVRYSAVTKKLKVENRTSSPQHVIDAFNGL